MIYQCGTNQCAKTDKTYAIECIIGSNGSNGSGDPIHCPGNKFCNDTGWGWLTDGEGGCSASSSFWKGNGCSCACQP